MTTKDEVLRTVEALSVYDTLKLALEALEDYVEEYGPHEQDSGVAYAITAIRVALASKSEALMSFQDGASEANHAPTWVGLTDEERSDIINAAYDDHYNRRVSDTDLEIARAVEAKLKEKNA